MMDQSLFRLASAAGISTSWKDVFGETHAVSLTTLRAVLAALKFPANSEEQLRDSFERVTTRQRLLPPVVTAEQGLSISLPVPAARYQLVLANGGRLEGELEAHQHGAVVPAIHEPGYHKITCGEFTTTLAVAPKRCLSVREALGGRKGWGLALQLYALRRPADAGVGDFAALARFAPSAAAQGADALSISPVHAQFSADHYRFAPYAPSSRTALNVMHVATDLALPELERSAFVEWPMTANAKLQHLRQKLDKISPDDAERVALAAFRLTQGDRLQGHAVFEALHAHFLQVDPSLWHWNTWPFDYQSPHSAGVQRFAAEHAKEVEFHAWLQFLADRQLGAAQEACRAAGMGIGLISDLAVGADSGGSQCWSRQTETLLALTVGAPPDLLQRDGQNWGLTAFSPTGLIESGFATYRDMLQTALVHAGGMRIDHAMGLNRLWVIPEGANASEGAYLSFPEKDLMSLIKLESYLHRAVVLAEDLGTIPDGFQGRLSEAGMEGMRILSFERDKGGRFVEPSSWTPQAVAMTSTHDLPTLAGWWSERDLDWQEKLGLAADVTAARAERGKDRSLLWEALKHSGAAVGDQPDSDHLDRFVDAACRHVGSSACEFAMVPIEDALGLIEQPNLPGTTTEHPNWRRRLAAETPESILHDAASKRLTSLNEVRLQQDCSS